MLQCKDCEYYGERADGSPHFLCDPFSTVKEPDCLVKWQLVELRLIGQSHQATLDMYRRFAPLQEKLFTQMEREIDEVNEADNWKFVSDDDDAFDDDSDPLSP